MPAEALQKAEYQEEETPDYEVICPYCETNYTEENEQGFSCILCGCAWYNIR